MIVLLAWLLIVLFFYFKQSEPMFEYVAFLAKNHGTFSLWHAYALKALGAFALAVWIVWVGTQYGRRLLARIVPAASMSRLEELVFSAGLGFGLIGFVTFALGVLRLWYAGVFWGMLIVATLRVSDPLRSLRSRLSPSGGGQLSSHAPEAVAHKTTWVLLILTGVIFLLGDLSPEVFYDSLHYHLAVPNLYLISHRISDQPHLAFSNFVMTADLVWGFAQTLGNEITPKVLHGATALLLLLAFVAFEQRYLAPGAGILGGLFFLSTPLVGMNVITAGIDVAAAALQLLGVFALARGLTDSEEEPAASRWLILAGIYTGLAASCKYTALPAIPLGCLLVIWWRQPRKRQEWKATGRQLALFAVSAILLVVPYFAKSFVFHRNPVYPIAGTFLGEPRITPENWQSIANEEQTRKFGDFASVDSLVRLALQPWSTTMQGKTGQDFIGPLLLGLLPVILLIRPPGKAHQFLIHYGVGLAVVWLLTTPIPRFAMPLLAVASLVGANALVNLLKAGPGLWQRAVLWLSLAVVATNLYFTLFFNANSENWRVLFGQISEHDYLAEAHPTYPNPGYEAFAWMNEHLPAGSRVLVAGDSRTLYTRVPVVASSVYNPQVIVELARQASSGDEMARLLREQGITHIFINFAEAVRTESYELFRWDAHSWDVLSDFWARYPELVWVSYRPDPSNLKGLFVFKLRSDKETRHDEPPATNPFVRWKPK